LNFFGDVVNPMIREMLTDGQDAGKCHVFRIPPRYFRLGSGFTFRNWYACFSIQTRLPRNATPSVSSRRRCSNPDSPGKRIFPPAPNTRCHGNPRAARRAQTTCRAQPGKPAAAATSPYVDTLPLGILRIVSRIMLNMPRLRIFRIAAQTALRGGGVGLRHPLDFLFDIPQRIRRDRLRSGRKIEGFKRHPVPIAAPA
jgi:hypothetical protein